MTCPLCEFIRECGSPLFTVATCKTCGIPLFVYRNHTPTPPEEHIKLMIEEAKKRYGKNVKIRFQMRSIPSHYHFHVEVRT